MEFTRQGMVTAMMVSMPILAVSLFVGVIVSVFQAITQVQEMTLTFVPKILGAAAVVSLMGGWMIMTLVGFMRMCFEQASNVLI